jgi:hypothetical protein
VGYLPLAEVQKETAADKLQALPGFVQVLGTVGCAKVLQNALCALKVGGGGRRGAIKNM